MRILMTVLLALISQTIHSSGINVIPGLADAPLVETFDSYPNGQEPNIIILNQGHQASGIFTNQDSGELPGPKGPWETATTDPERSDPLTLVAQGEHMNLSFTDINHPDNSNIVYPWPDGQGTAIGGLLSEAAGIGPVGAVSFLLAYDVHTIGISVYGVANGHQLPEDAGEFTIELFDRTGGSLGIEMVQLNLDSRFFTIETDDLEAIIAGVTFTNTDAHGLLFDDLRLAAPTPSTPLLMLFGYIALRWQRRTAQLR